MKDSPTRAPSGTDTPDGHRAAGIAMTLAAAASNQTGAAVGATAFPVIGPVGVVAVRQLITAAVLGGWVRPRLRRVPRDLWPALLGLGLVFSVMNLCLYVAVDRIGLGLAVTLEFLGPLGVAIAGSRRALDLGCAVLAAVGVVVLTAPGPSTDLLGIVPALVAAAAWAAYILLNRHIGATLPGIEGTAIASLVACALWVPIAGVWFAAHHPTPTALALAAACGILSSVIGYATDMRALRRIPAALFGTLTSVNPVWAALAGLLVLGQSLAAHEWIGITLIVTGNFAVTVAAGGRHRHPGADRHRRRGGVQQPRQGASQSTTVPDRSSASTHAASAVDEPAVPVDRSSGSAPRSHSGSASAVTGPPPVAARSAAS